MPDLFDPPGLSLFQLALMLAGALAGARIVEDVRAWRAVRQKAGKDSELS